MENIEFIVKYKDKEYKFDYGVKAYIFHTGVFNDIDFLYDIDTLLEYVDFVFECYLDDCDRTPIGDLADYIAKDWGNLKEKSPRTVLEEYYS